MAATSLPRGLVEARCCDAVTDLLREMSDEERRSLYLHLTKKKFAKLRDDFPAHSCCRLELPAAPPDQVPRDARRHHSVRPRDAVPAAR